jgi:hypothetical protein
MMDNNFFHQLLPLHELPMVIQNRCDCLGVNVGKIDGKAENAVILTATP